MQLRRVTQDFPDSAYANDAYFEIGQIHFDAGRWTKAAEAFRMVGTAVPTDGATTNDAAYAEAGQRLYIHVKDRDLPVLAGLKERLAVNVVAKSGDSEDVVLEPYGRDDGGALASVETVTEPSAPNDGRLTVQGGEEVTVTYVDKTNSEGQTDVPIKATTQIVSTGILAFMDGAYRQRVKGVFAGQPAFLRLRDLDLDATPQVDRVTLAVVASYPKPRPTGEELAAGAEPVAEGDDTWIERGRIDVELTESAPRSGVFEGRFTPVVPTEGATTAAVGQLAVAAEDRLVVEYTDVRHLGGLASESRAAEVVVLVGGSTDPQSIVANSSDATIQARKLLLEAQLLHKWGSIFKEVGLDGHAKAKADEGLQRVDEVMALASRHSLDRAVVEQTFAAKWDLQLVQDKLAAAIGTCHALVRLYPDTVLADLAFMRIAAARAASKDSRDIQEGIRVYQSVLSLPKSACKAEAQFGVAQALEKLAKLDVRGDRQPDFSAAIQAFRVCAETYPESSYAGESFQRIVNYHIGLRDYARAVETLDRVFQDYPDSPWLDEMLVRWGIVLHRMGDREGAVAKFRRVLEEYPGGPAAQQAATFLERLQQ
jgi:tetratricopeptide (TPR) repeat protein